MSPQEGFESDGTERVFGLKRNRHADPTADFTAEELVELAQLRRFHGIGDSVEEIRESLGYRAEPSSPLEGDSNFEFDNNVMDDVARKFYQVEEDNLREAVSVVYGFAIENPSLQDAIRMHGKGIIAEDDTIILPAVPDDVVAQVRAELAEYEAQRQRIL